jgi:hypothetical protein
MIYSFNALFKIMSIDKLINITKLAQVNNVQFESPRVFPRLQPMRRWAMKMKATTHYSPQIQEQAVRMVNDHQGEYTSKWAEILRIAPD